MDHECTVATARHIRCVIRDSFLSLSFHARAQGQPDHSRRGDGARDEPAIESEHHAHQSAEPAVLVRRRCGRALVRHARALAVCPLPG